MFLISEEILTMLSADLLWFLQPIILLSIEVESLEAFHIDSLFENLSLVTIRRELEKNGGDIYESLSKQVCVSFSLLSQEQE